MKDFPVELKKITSKKSGKQYYILEISITETYTKTVFLDPAETEIVKLAYTE